MSTVMKESPATEMKDRSAYSPGLEGVIAGESALCLVDEGEAGLLYRGYAIHDLAEHSTFEEVAYLLLFGQLPTRQELKDFSARLIEQAVVPQDEHVPLAQALHEAGLLVGARGDPFEVVVSDLVDEQSSDLPLPVIHPERAKPTERFAHLHGRDLRNVLAVNANGQGFWLEPQTAARRAWVIRSPAAQKDANVHLVLSPLEPVEETGQAAEFAFRDAVANDRDLFGR